MPEPIPTPREAPLQETPTGHVPNGPGWFVLSAREAPWETLSGYGRSVRFEDREHEFPEFGLNIHRLEPGEPNGYYHAESTQEGFLVVHGRCTLLVEGEERELTAWDYFHCAPGTAHVLIGAGDGPCVVVMVGARRSEAGLFYPVEEKAVAARAGVTTPTSDPREAYSNIPDSALAAYGERWLPG